MFTGVLEETGDVVMVKFALDCPAETVTLAGTCAAVLSLERVTTAPPEGATPFSVTVPVEDEPPATAAGFSARLLTPPASELTVSVAALLVTEPAELLTITSNADPLSAVVVAGVT
jgi:hypothetical protein